MEHFVWTTDLETGNAEIDAQHRATKCTPSSVLTRMSMVMPALDKRGLMMFSRMSEPSGGYSAGTSMPMTLAEFRFRSSPPSAAAPLRGEVGLTVGRGLFVT